MRTKDLFTSFLELLQVKHTQHYSGKLFREHPHKYNLFGLSRMLSDYGVENAGLKIKNKEQGLYELEPPFIAHVSDDFHLIYTINSKEVGSISNGKRLKIPTDDFLKIWSGVALVAEKDETSIEPDYTKNRKKEISDNIQKHLLIILLLASLLAPFIIQQLYKDVWTSTLLALNLIGVYICFLLVQKQLHIHSEYADKICSLFNKSDCNNVLESEASKFMGIIGWSEAGLGYFVSNTIILLFFPHLIPFCAIINLCALPYSFWSVWYQKVKAKQWCPLCLIVQMLFWSLFFVNLTAGYIQIPPINPVNFTIICCIYFIPFILFNLLIPQLSESGKIEQIKQEMNSFKSDEDVLAALLKKQSYYETSKISQILFGNEDGKLKVTILTNPHCAPCAKMHQRVKKVIEQNNQLSIQYIFSSFEKELDSSNQFLIAAYQNNTKKIAENIFDEWFDEGKNSKQAFFEKHKFIPDHITKEVEAEFLKHEAWKEDTKLRETPTVLVNGYKLPNNYKIEDLQFITKINS